MTEPHKSDPSPASPLLQFVIESIRRATAETNQAADKIDKFLAGLRVRA